MTEEVFTSSQKFVHSINPDRENEDPHHFHKTPRRGITSLLAVEKFENVIWEPACGDGAISEPMKEYGYDVVSSDLIDRGYGHTGVDFLTSAICPRNVNAIVTNPPFKHGVAFAKRALSFNPQKVAMLYRTLYLEGLARTEFYRESKLTRVWVFSKRINIPRSGNNVAWPNEDGGMVSFAWFVWERGHVGPPSLEWI